MKLNWMILANYVELREGVIRNTIVSGAWDRIYTSSEEPSFPDAPVAVLNGGLAIRLFASREEADVHHEMVVTVRHMDGEEIHSISGGFVMPAPSDDDYEELPGLGIPVLIPINVAGLPLPAEGWYEVALEVDGQELASSPFRVRQRQDYLHRA